MLYNYLQPFSLELTISAFRSIKFLCINQVIIIELKQCPRCQVFLKSIQYLSLSNVFTSSDIIIVIVWLKHIFISKFFAQHIHLDLFII